MKPFHTIAVLHKDILEGRLTMDVFAADLWEVYHDRGPEEYRDADLFSRKTFVTAGLNHIFQAVEKRMNGQGGDPVIQLQTPFGGGKTHALIAIYHKAREWKAKPVVLVGTALNPKSSTLWGLLEEQLTGKITKFKDPISPGSEEIRELLEKNQPVVILMDEVLEYVTKAAGIKVGDTNLAAQTIAFIQELTEAVRTIEKACLILTLPSSIMEHYDETAEKLFQQLQKATGRVEKINTPVDEDEIKNVVIRRLFSRVNKEEANEIASEVADFFKKENILPVGEEASEYRKNFVESYPFLPDVIDCFYHRWGSYPTFQRTRGVLRLLSLIIYSLKNANVGYISLSDIDLGNQDIRRELLKHIGNEYDSIISADITSKNSGSKQVDSLLGESYKGLSIGTRTGTTAFLYSFSGGAEKGSSINEIKRSVAVISVPPSIVSEAVELVKERLFYVQQQTGKLCFTNKPNLNRIVLNKIENIDEKEASSLEKEILSGSTRGGKLKTYIWPKQSGDIPDDSELKLIVLREKNATLMKSIIETKGESPRVYRNTIFFLTPVESRRSELDISLKKKMAFEQIEKDPALKLTDEQKNEVKRSTKREEETVRSKTRDIYRLVQVPQKDKVEGLDLGMPVYGTTSNISDEVFERLKSEGLIIDRMAPLVLKEKYLSGKKHVSTKQIFENSLKTLGERRLFGKASLEECIKSGVRQGVFGLGEFEGVKEKAVYWKAEPSVGFFENEILIDEKMCAEQLGTVKAVTVESAIQKDVQQEEASSGKEFGPLAQVEAISRLDIEPVRVPKGKVSQFLGLLNYIQTKFDNLEVKITADGGSLKKDEYENKVKEALRQINS